MNKIKVILLIIGTFLLTGCRLNFDTPKYIQEEINIDISSCIILRDNDTHNIFGLGEMLVEANCKYDQDNFINQIKDWNKLPLSENLQIIMYNEEIDEEESEYQFAKKNKIPEIKNGYYYFIDRYDKRLEKSSDEKLFNQTSFKFTLVLYDTDTNTFYYYEYDK